MGRRSWEWPKHEEVVATSMLLEEPAPVICSACLGRHVAQGLFMVHACGQCGGCGYDLIGEQTAKAVGINEDELPRHAAWEEWRRKGVKR